MLPGRIALDLLTAGQAVKTESFRCVRMRFAASECRQCEKVCPQGAISLAPGAAVAADQCSGCQLCEATCPTGVFRGGMEKLMGALRTLAAVSNPILGCSRREGVKAHARIGCLGLMANPEILLAVSILLPGGLTLNLTRCGNCPNRSVVAKIKGSVASLVGPPGQYVHGAVRLAESEAALQFQERTISRRDFFGYFHKKGAGIAIDSVDRLHPRPVPVSRRRKKIPVARAMLLQALPQMNPALKQETVQQLFPVAHFHRNCQKCSGCVGICPTGALAPPKGEGSAPLFESGHCTVCGLCEIFCSRGGISISKA